MNAPVLIHVTGPAIAEASELAAAAAPKETGGLLLGWWTDGTVIVRHAIEVLDPKASRFSWNRRPRAARRALNDALQVLHHPLLGYVGDWHSHPEVCGASRRDEESLAKTSQGYREPLALLVHLPNGTIDVRAAHAGTLRPGRLQTSNDTNRAHRSNP